MASKRKPAAANATKLNFRPSMSDNNIDPKGTKPTSEPTSVVEIFTLMVLFVCKKSLFLNVYLKIVIYLGCLFLVSLIADVVTIPKTYLARSDNILNRYFVKFAWGWNLLLITPFIILTAYIYCCGKKNRILKHHIPRIFIATFFWWFWTTMFNVVEAAFGKCAVKGFDDKTSCLEAGHIWKGFDISGHSFILIYGTLFLVEEAKCILNWDTIKDHIRLENHKRVSRDNSENRNPLKNLTDEEIDSLQANYEKYTPYIRIIFIVITCFQVMWDLMLVSTMLYYHVMVEKLLGGFIAIATWFVTYQVWFAYPFLLPKLPGEGAFKYSKEKVTREPFPAARRRIGSVVNNGNQVPMFMGRPIYPQTSEVRQEDLGR